MPQCLLAYRNGKSFHGWQNRVVGKPEPQLRWNADMTTPIAIKGKEDVDILVRILETFSQLDDMRWSTQGKRNLINYCCNDLSDDERLLTHWLSYISDRQTPYERLGGRGIRHFPHGPGL